MDGGRRGLRGEIGAQRVAEPDTGRTAGHRRDVPVPALIQGHPGGGDGHTHLYHRRFSGLVAGRAHRQCDLPGRYRFCHRHDAGQQHSRTREHRAGAAQGPGPFSGCGRRGQAGVAGRVRLYHDHRTGIYSRRLRGAGGGPALFRCRHRHFCGYPGLDAGGRDRAADRRSPAQRGRQWRWCRGGGQAPQTTTRRAHACNYPLAG